MMTKCDVTRSVCHAMETLVPDQNSSVETSQAGGDQSSSVGGSNVAQSDGSRSTGSSSGQVRANGTVVLTSPAQVVTSSQNTPTLAVPQPGGVSIVHLAIPNQPVHVQSVIQPGPNQQSVIQAPGGATLQPLQISKNVFLLNKLPGQGSVIHSTDGDASLHPVQLITTAKDEDGGTVTLVASEDPKKRREILARRPSYRKILSDLSSTDAHSALTASAAAVLKEEAGNLNESSQEADSGSSTITVGGTQYTTTNLLKAIQLAATTQDSGIQGLQTLTMTNTGSGATGAIVQYTQNQDGQFFVPVTVSAADLQAYQIRAANSPTGLTQSVVSNIQTIQSPQQIAEEASRKRELRLLKNREAAKECRRKKKEYIKCLENRVAVLENQNKALIEELKSLKELYCQKKD